jgi:hypothetical protein
MAVAANPPQPTDKLSGLIDRITYFSETTGFAVLKVIRPGIRMKSLNAGRIAD